MKIKMKPVFYTLFILSLFVVICVGFYSTPSVASFAVKNHLSVQQSKKIFITKQTRHVIKKCIGENAADRWNFLINALDQSTQLNDICQLGNQFFIDVTQTISNEKIHMIYQVKDQSIMKYYDAGDFVIKNDANKTIYKIGKSFESADITKRNVKYVDPFTGKGSGFSEKNKGINLQESIYLERFNQTILLTVYEITDQPKDIKKLCWIYPAETELTIIALHNQTIVSNIINWCSERVFNDAGRLNDEMFLCKEKEFQFRYGRQVGIKEEPDGQERMFVDTWESASAVFTLQKPYLVNFPLDCVHYRILQYPESMKLCDAFYREKGLAAYWQEALG